MKLVLGNDYPAAPPRGYFLTKIYHPNVSSSGDICVNTLKKDWKSDTTLKHVLQVIRCLLIVPFPESSLNDEAGKLFMESYDEFARRATIMTSVHAAPADGTSGKEGKVGDQDVASATTSAASAVKASSSAKSKKERESKKKSLKRL
jgi:ubiquitin-conjugating enzyme E2 S